MEALLLFARTNRRRFSWFRLAAFFVLAGLLAGCEGTPATAPATCGLAQLTAAATWSGVRDTALLGRLSLTNYTVQSCPLDGNLTLALVDASQQPLAVVFQGGVNLPASLEAGQTLELAFTWQNWCGTAPEDGLTLRLSLEGTPGALNTPLQDPNGQPLHDAPHCMDAAQPSLLAWIEN